MISNSKCNFCFYVIDQKTFKNDLKFKCNIYLQLQMNCVDKLILTDMISNEKWKLYFYFIDQKKTNSGF